MSCSAREGLIKEKGLLPVRTKTFFTELPLLKVCTFPLIETSIRLPCTTIEHFDIVNIFEPAHDKTYSKTCATSKHSLISFCWSHVPAVASGLSKEG